MARNCSSPDRGIFTAVVCANKQIRERFYRLGLEFSGAGATAFAEAKPGQFAELDLCSAALPKGQVIPEELIDISSRKILLRRPFSFADVAVKKGQTIVDILYCVAGPATLRMATLSAGDSISVIGPLGNGFCPPREGKKTALLAAGGMGVGPLIYMAKVLTADYPQLEVFAFVGAKTVSQLPFERQLDEISQQLGFPLAEFAGYGIESIIATDDGSVGFAGTVTDCLTEWLGQHTLAAENTIIYSCGPEAMLAKIAEIAKDKRIDCQISTERMMACGIGICQSCAVECKPNEASETVYKLCCKDGPVFDSKEIVFSS